MARDDPQINIRLPAGLKQRIEEAAQTSGRSMAAEFAHRLERSFAIPDPDLAFLTAKFEADMAQSDLQAMVLRLRIAELSRTVEVMAGRLRQSGADFNSDEVTADIKHAQVALRDALDGMVDATEAINRLDVARSRLRVRFEAARKASLDRAS